VSQADAGEVDTGRGDAACQPRMRAFVAQALWVPGNRAIRRWPTSSTILTWASPPARSSGRTQGCASPGLKQLISIVGTGSGAGSRTARVPAARTMIESTWRSSRSRMDACSTKLLRLVLTTSIRERGSMRRHASRTWRLSDVGHRRPSGHRVPPTWHGLSLDRVLSTRAACGSDGFGPRPLLVTSSQGVEVEPEKLLRRGQPAGEEEGATSGPRDIARMPGRLVGVRVAVAAVP